MRTLIYAIAGLILLSPCSMGAADETWNSISVPLRTIILEPPDNTTPKFTPVYFPHPLHFDYSCRRCHHMWDGYTEIQNCASSQCHSRTTPPGSFGINEAQGEEYIRYYKNAYHDLCIECHKDLKTKQAPPPEDGKKEETAEKEKTAPTLCFECHPKGSE